MTNAPASHTTSIVEGLLVVIVGASIGIWSGMSTRIEPAPTAMTTTIGVGAPRLDVSPRVATKAAAAGWGARAVAKEVAMREAYTRSIDLSAFFEDALRHPENGGLFYARAAFFDCGALRNVKPGRDLGGDVVARDRLGSAQVRCGTVGESTSRSRLHEVWLNAWRSDPAMSIYWALQAGPAGTGKQGFDESQEALDRAIALGDPGVFRWILPIVIGRARSFDGRPIDGALSDDLGTASIVAACDLGLECSSDFISAYTCLLPNGCADSIITAVLRNDGLTDERRKRVAVLTDRLVGAAHDGSLPRLFQ